MINKRILFYILGWIVSVVFTSYSFAGLIDYKRIKRIREQKAQGIPLSDEDKNVPDWMITEPDVTNEVEKKYDFNRDKKLQTSEIKIYLRDVIEEVNKKGGYSVDSDILKPYDKNNDAAVTKGELEKIEEHAR